MAFGGPNEGGKARVVPGIDKFRLPRYVIWNNTNLNFDFNNTPIRDQRFNLLSIGNNNIKSYIG